MSNPLGWHVGLRRADDRVLAEGPRERRALSRVVLRHGERAGLVAYRAVDTHLHAELLCDRDGAGRFARHVGRGVALELGRSVPLVMSFAKPLEGQWHGQSALRYILAQERRHGLDSDPFHEASNLPDLLGLRVVGRYTAALLAAHFPRVRREELVALLGCPQLTVAGDPRLLADSAAATLALPDLAGRSEEAVAARRAAVHAAGRALTAEDLASLLGGGVRTVDRLRAQACDPDLLHAVRAQWRLRSSSAARAAAVRDLRRPCDRDPALEVAAAQATLRGPGSRR